MAANEARRQKTRHLRQGADAQGNANTGRRTASQKTLEFYSERGKLLIERYKREERIRIANEDIDPRRFADWVLALLLSVSRDARRMYRASAKFAVQSIPSHYTEEALAILQVGVGVGADEGRSVCRSGKDKAADRMSLEHWQALKKRLPSIGRGQVADRLMDWLDAGIHTGVRPMEWVLTSIAEVKAPGCAHAETILLHVSAANAGGSIGSYRTLDITSFSPETLAAVIRHVQASREWALAGTTANRQSEVSQLLRDACGILFSQMKSYYTLDSLRHQFIANMKAIYLREEVAAMAGTLDIDKPPRQYIKRRKAWLKTEITEIPIPLPEQVARVRELLKLADERRELKELKLAARLRKSKKPSCGTATLLAAGGRIRP